MPERVAEFFLSESTFYLAWGITIATVFGFLWQGIKWIHKKMELNKKEQEEQDTKRHCETRKVVENVAKDLKEEVTRETAIIKHDLKNQNDIVESIKKVTEGLDGKVDAMQLKLVEHAAIFEHHAYVIGQLTKQCDLILGRNNFAPFSDYRDTTGKKERLD